MYFTYSTIAFPQFNMLFQLEVPTCFASIRFNPLCHDIETPFNAFANRTGLDQAALVRTV